MSHQLPMYRFVLVNSMPEDNLWRECRFRSMVQPRPSHCEHHGGRLCHGDYCWHGDGAGHVH